MPMQPTRRDRWLALALLLAALLLAYLLLVHPWFTVPLQAIGQDITALQERQQRVQAQLRQQPQVTARLAQVRTVLQARPGFLPDATAESAAATLGTRMQEAVTAASQSSQSCSISNRTPMTGERSDSAYTRVGLQVRLRCGVDELASVLAALEEGAPRVFVENLNVLAQRYQQSPDETGTGLDVSFEVVGYLDPSAGADTPAAATPSGAARMQIGEGDSAADAPTQDLPADAAGEIGPTGEGQGGTDGV